jgi:hypothetical protein
VLTTKAAIAIIRIVGLDQPSGAVRLPYSRPWRATLALDTPIHSKHCFFKRRGAGGTRRRVGEFGSRTMRESPGQAQDRQETRTRTMTMHDRPADFADLVAIASAIERSQIVFRCISLRPTLRFARRADLPTGFEDIDIAILEWIAAEGRRTLRLSAAIASATLLRRARQGGR